MTTEMFHNRLIMAPMSRGTDLPFRRLVSEWGGELCVGEMAYAHKIVKRVRGEMPLIRRHPSENLFGVQLAGKHPDVMAEAAVIVEGEGADFIDINLGCPIEDATRRGFGAALLKRASRVAAMVEAMKKAVQVPVTVKMRLGWSSEKPTYLKIARAAQEAGADAVILHARSRAQRYRRPADWSHVKTLVDELSIPVIGNGDIMTWKDAEARKMETGCAAIMVGRWALAKPWLFKEFLQQANIEQDTAGRVAVLRRYVELCLELLGDDERGRERTRRFLTFHQDFFGRYRRQADENAVNAEDPRSWGAPPADDMEGWLCRTDKDGVEALCRWLVDGGPDSPPARPEGKTVRAVKVTVSG
jgi:tRNA-dihydrouridine synthase 3